MHDTTLEFLANSENYCSRQKTWQSDRSLPPLVGPGTRECNYQTEWVVGVGSDSFITYYTHSHVSPELWLWKSIHHAIARYGPTWRREDIYSSDWGPVGREKCFLILFSFPAAAPPSLSPNTKQVQLQLLQLTIHSELINIWAGRPVLPGLVLRWLSLYCSPVTIISASHWSVLALVTPVWPLIGWQGVVSPGEAGYLIISWFVVFIIFYYQMLKLQVIFQAAIISVNHAQFRWLARFALNTSVLKGLLLFF